MAMSLPSCNAGKLREKRCKSLCVEWEIDDFLSLTLPVYDSPIFRFSDSAWFLRICLENDNPDWLEADLQRNEISSTETSITYQFGIQKADGTLHLQRKRTKKFAERQGCTAKQFLRKSELRKRKSEWLSSGALTVVCSLRNPDPPQALRRRSKGLKDIHTCMKFSDVTILVGQKTFYAHKVLLSASSPKFADMLELEMEEDTLTISDCDPALFEVLLEFVYTGEADITESNVLNLCRIARKYRVEDLTSFCVAFMMADDQYIGQ